MKVAFVISNDGIENSIDSSYKNLLKTTHPSVEQIYLNQNKPEEVFELQHKIASGLYLGAVFCEKTIRCFPKIHIPKMVISTDFQGIDRNYAHKIDHILEADYVLSAYASTHSSFNLPLSVSADIRNRFIYFPHYSVDQPCKAPHYQRNPIIISAATDRPEHLSRREMSDRLVEFGPAQSRESAPEDRISIFGKYRVALLDDVGLGYCSAEYFQIPMARSLLVALEPYTEFELKLLGYNDTNSLMIHRDKAYDFDYVERRIRQALADLSASESRAALGQSLVRRRHTREARVRYILKLMQQINARSFCISDQFECFLSSEDKNEIS